jgi:hypothetical protein
VGPTGSLHVVEKRKFLTLPGLELRLLGRPARSQSLHRLTLSRLLIKITINRRLSCQDIKTVCTRKEYLFTRVRYRACTSNDPGHTSLTNE